MLGSTKGQLLFAIIVDELTRELRGEEIWELLFADDLAVMNRKKKGLQKRLKRWQRCLEKGGLKVNVAKTETLVCKNGGGEVLRVRDVHGEDIRQVKELKYLDTVLCEGGGSSKDVQERVKAGWRKCGEVSAVMEDKRMGMRLKAKVYQTVVRPVLTCGAQCWALNKR